MSKIYVIDACSLINAAPFLIATAALYGGIVITDEGTKVNGIPFVCQGLGIEYINLSTYLDRILE